MRLYLKEAPQIICEVKMRILLTSSFIILIALQNWALISILFCKAKGHKKTAVFYAKNSYSFLQNKLSEHEFTKNASRITRYYKNQFMFDLFRMSLDIQFCTCITR